MGFIVHARIVLIHQIEKQDLNGHQGKGLRLIKISANIRKNTPIRKNNGMLYTKRSTPLRFYKTSVIIILKTRNVLFSIRKIMPKRIKIR